MSRLKNKTGLVNVLAVAHTVRTALPFMKDGGRIINIGSTVAVAHLIGASASTPLRKPLWQPIPEAGPGI
ncbi:hypothetical protein J2Y44_003935 [Dyadobacter sp. BE32]|uniref:Short-chain dehydrogenase/reductase SDR n=1 Tax=Dyadobacter fermentans TaxID=94254 RepID=A0ABU1R0G1_9BACT|nr:hypothetical protein [Dyadobacter sp. BE242]MDR6806020.1 hypothetical protein [Dyadobacter fermentans]MDR7043761.1 hypothetical protein [Dyadobacter sp. BE242]MDR7216035.1 hypothetical protein [Dyadobacter sp. BE31]MDR7264439.1 hypothetical protein [Dyadobacter sp. BE32]